jgi:hypothetical protein
VDEMGWEYTWDWEKINGIPMKEAREKGQKMLVTVK